MIHWLHQPTSSVVSTFIECYWLIEKKQGADGFQFPKLNPDPSAHVIISPTNQTYTYQADEGIESGVGSHLLFPHLHTFQLDHTQPFIHLGIKFKVGALYSIKLPNNPHPILDKVIPFDLQTLIETDEFAISNLLLLAQSNGAECSDQLDSLLTPWLSQYQQDKFSKLTSRALELLDSTSITKLGNELHCNQRTLERTFSRVTGLTLKQCQSMRRLEAMLEYLYTLRKDEIDWVDVAYKFGFSDQPHLIRYLKVQLGLTPNTYAKERSLTIDAYGGVANYLGDPL